MLKRLPTLLTMVCILQIKPRVRYKPIRSSVRKLLGEVLYQTENMLALLVTMCCVFHSGHLLREIYCIKQNGHSSTVRGHGRGGVDREPYKRMHNHSGVGSCDLLRMRKYSFRGERQEGDGGVSVYKREERTKTPFCCQNFNRTDS